MSSAKHREKGQGHLLPGSSNSTAPENSIAHRSTSDTFLQPVYTTLAPKPLFGAPLVSWLAQHQVTPVTFQLMVPLH